MKGTNQVTINMIDKEGNQEYVYLNVSFDSKLYFKTMIAT